MRGSWTRWTAMPDGRRGGTTSAAGAVCTPCAMWSMSMSCHVPIQMSLPQPEPRRMQATRRATPLPPSRDRSIPPTIQPTPTTRGHTNHTTTSPQRTSQRPPQPTNAKQTNPTNPASQSVARASERARQRALDGWMEPAHPPRQAGRQAGASQPAKRPKKAQSVSSVGPSSRPPSIHPQRAAPGRPPIDRLHALAP